MSDTFDVSNIISILGDKETGIIGFYLSMSLFLFLCFLQCSHLVLIKDNALLFHFGRQCFQAFLEGLHIVPQPNGAYSARRNKNAFLPQFIGYTHLPQCRIVYRHPYHSLLDVFFHTVLYDRLTA